MAQGHRTPAFFPHVSCASAPSSHSSEAPLPCLHSTPRLLPSCERRAHSSLYLALIPCLVWYLPSSLSSCTASSVLLPTYPDNRPPPSAHPRPPQTWLSQAKTCWRLPLHWAIIHVSTRSPRRRPQRPPSTPTSSGLLILHSPLPHSTPTPPPFPAHPARRIITMLTSHLQSGQAGRWEKGERGGGAVSTQSWTTPSPTPHQALTGPSSVPLPPSRSPDASS